VADFVVLASGSGSNFEAIARYPGLAEHRLLALISDNPHAYALTRAERLAVASVVVNYGAGRRDAETRLGELLSSFEPALVVLAGFMKVLPARIVDRFPDRIVNIHPSLLPGHPGLHAIEASFLDPTCGMGVTIHVVDHGVDTGRILAQYEAESHEVANLEQMEARIHKLEHEHYPAVIATQLRLLDEGAAEASSP